MTVTDVTSGQQAVEAAKQVKALMKKLEGKRKELLDPINARAKAIRDYASEIEAPLLRAEQHIKAQLVAFEERQERIRQEARREEERKRQEIERKAAEERAAREAEIAAKRQAELDAIKEKEFEDDLFGDGAVDGDAERRAAEARAAEAEAQARAEAETQAKIREIEASQRQYDINANRLKNTKKAWKCEATNLDEVPRHFLTITLNTQAVLAAARGGTTSIPGVRLWQETQVAIGANTSLKSLTNFGGNQS
jgi:hypothetical protein